MSNQIKKFARQCVRNYATYSDLDGFYSLDVSDISDFDLNHFATLFMQDRERANESCGSDNSIFDKTMLPSLMKFLGDPCSVDKQKDFMESWRKGVTKYFMLDMQLEIDDELALYNMEHAA